MAGVALDGAAAGFDTTFGGAAFDGTACLVDTAFVGACFEGVIFTTEVLGATGLVGASFGDVGRAAARTDEATLGRLGMETLGFALGGLDLIATFNIDDGTEDTLEAALEGLTGGQFAPRR